ncbi:hypothetical protein ACQPYK_19780 [Streptosporangium sp. CA-135522]|uniref:GntT/GntP/DsdX family permease n=1 Tax=Streptosporangium sp. CA-135522 TaxID=3240072 RepID=UPI003D8B3911
MGLTLALGVLVALPTVAIAGPLFSKYAARWVDVPAPELYEARTGTEDIRRPAFGVTLATVLLPVVLMMGKALADIFAPKTNAARMVLDFLGTPLVALLIAVIVAMFTLGRSAAMDKRAIAKSLEQSLPPIAGFWLVKEYFRLTVGQNVKTWSTMETIISVTGLVLVLLLNLVV